MSINLMLLTDCATVDVISDKHVESWPPIMLPLILAFVVVLDVLLSLYHGIVVLSFIVFRDYRGRNICLCKIEGHLLSSNQKGVNSVVAIVVL